MSKKQTNIFSLEPLPYYGANLYNGIFNPSTIHVQNTSLYYFFWRYLFFKVFAAFDIDGQPEYWDNDYLKAALIIRGFCSVFDYEPVGVIPQACEVGNRIDIFYRPRTVTFVNAAIQTSKTEYEVGTDCELIKLTPDYIGLCSLISFYAENMALCAESAGINLANSQLAFVFRVKNPKQAAAFKEMIDKIRSGDIAAFVDKELFDDEGNPTWTAFDTDIRQHFIAPDVLEMLTAYESRFKEEIGIKDVPFEKKERMLTAEIEASTDGTSANIYTWLQCLNKSIANVNRHYNLALRAVLTNTNKGGVDNEQFGTFNN